ncbi:MAG: carboxypeptidase-like regulatory domain-containing protein [Bacteroidota bacterium]
MRIYGYQSACRRTISGAITSAEDAAPLEGVSVIIKGSNRASGTQADGIYYITVSPGDSILVFSYADFQTQEIKLGSSNEYNIVLRKGNNETQKTRHFLLTENGEEPSG